MHNYNVYAMQLLRDVINCDYSFAIHIPLAKVARLKYTQNIPKVWDCLRLFVAFCILVVLELFKYVC